MVNKTKNKTLTMKTLEHSVYDPHDTHSLSPHNLITRIDDDQTEQGSKCLNDLMDDPILRGIPEAEQFEAISDAFELYAKSKDIVAPVVTGFADALLREADGSRQIVFAARDGLGAFEAAKILLRKFPEEYATKEIDTVYAYLTRRLVYDSTPAMIQQYLEELGVDTQKPVLLADIGMYGSIMDRMRQVMPNVEARYVISRNPDIPGFADDSSSRSGMTSLSAIVGNPAVHFLEDTFSGLTSSPDRLVEVGGHLVPNIVENAFEPKELLKRKYAIRAFIDYADSLTTPPIQSEKMSQIAALDRFLADSDQYRHLMVPHIH